MFVALVVSPLVAFVLAVALSSSPSSFASYSGRCGRFVLTIDFVDFVAFSSPSSPPSCRLGRLSPRRLRQPVVTAACLRLVTLFPLSAYSSSHEGRPETLSRLFAIISCSSLCFLVES